MSERAEEIPWQFTDQVGVLQWAWVTEHFIARIVGQEVIGADLTEAQGQRLVRSYRWEIGDLMQRNQGMPRILVEGTAREFPEAEQAVREHVGKAYDPRLGYRRYSGAATFTFTLATGERLDVHPFIGTRCQISVLLPGGAVQVVSGEFDVRAYYWIVKSRDGEFEVVPEHVQSITNRSEVADRAAEITRSETYAGVGRIYREEYRSGCTGRPGFEYGTVDHGGSDVCPLHERGIPPHLLK